MSMNVNMSQAEVEAHNKKVAEEANTATPPSPRLPFSSLAPSERLYVCRIAANQGPGGKLPLGVRRAILADYEGVPEASFAPDPVGPGWAEKLASGAETALLAVIGTAAGLVGLLLVVEAAKAVLRSVGALGPSAPAALPVAIAPDEVGIDEAKLPLPRLPYMG